MSRWRRVLLLLLLAALGGLAALPAAPVVARPIPPQAASVRAFHVLQLRAAAPLDVRWGPRGSAEFLAARGDGRLPYQLPPEQSRDPEAIARDFLEQQRDLFGIRSAADELKLLRIEPDTQLGWAHVRFDQVYLGIPVFGRQLVVHLDKQGQPVAVNGQFTPGIDIPTEALLDAGQAADVALDDLRTVQLSFAEQLKIKTRVLSDKTQLVVYVDRADKPRLAWYVTVMTESPIGQWRYFVNARRPAVIHAFDSLADAKRRITYTADNTTDLPGQPLIDEGERSRDQVAQAAHDNAGVVYDYYAANFQRDSIDGQGGAIVSTVHFGSSQEEAENAAWISELQQMIYGDGGRIFRPLALGLDVVGHELTHGVTDHTAQLIYEGQSGALNESYSDVFGALIDDDDWTLGEDVVKSPPFPTPVLRSMEDPNLGGSYDPNEPLNGIGQPAHADEYANLPVSRRYDNGGVHINSGIPNHAAFLVAQALDRERTGQIYYRTLTQYLTPNADFFDAAAATVRAAQDLYGANEANAVRTAFNQVGIEAGEPDTLPPPAPGEDDIPDVPPVPDQPEPVPQGCSDLIVNGGFEASEGWVEVVAGDVAIIDPELPHSGKRSAWLGGTDQERLQLIYQELRVPPNATSVQLSYYRLVHEELSGLAGILAPDATFSTVIANTDGDVVATVEELSSAQGDDAWHQAEFDLSRFAGKTIRLAFAAENTSGNVSSFFVDDVSLAACTAGVAAPAPQPASADQVFIEGTVTDANTGRGIEGAQVFIMQPGLSASDAAADDTVAGDEVITYGVTDGNGFYRSGEAIPRGQVYSAIVIASDYRPIIADDGVEIPPDADNPLVADAQMRR
jgi:Zn-dependent metalloprotease